MQLHAWRTTGKNPCHSHSDGPPVTITIAPVEKMTFVYPWVLPLARAEEMFGQGVVDLIGEEPMLVDLEMTVHVTLPEEEPHA